MTKLTNSRILYICREVLAGRLTCRQAAGQYGVGVRRVQQLVAQRKETGKVPKLDPRRRPRGPPLTKAERDVIEDAWLRHRVGSRHLFRILREEGHPLPHNKVRQHLVDARHVLPNPNKQRQRKYCRYEREHSFSLLHADWHRSDETKPHCILWLDDASRMILSGGEFGEETAEHSVETLEAAIAVAASLNCEVREVNTDKGPQFFAHSREDEVLRGRNDATWTRKGPESSFQRFLRGRGIRHAVSRTGHPQTNGKAERLWLEYDRHRWRFSSLDDFVQYYNHRIHGSLWWDIAETPAMALMRKLPQEAMLGMFWRLAEC